MIGVHSAVSGSGRAVFAALLRGGGGESRVREVITTHAGAASDTQETEEGQVVTLSELTECTYW